MRETTRKTEATETEMMNDNWPFNQERPSHQSVPIECSITENQRNLLHFWDRIVFWSPEYEMFNYLQSQNLCQDLNLVNLVRLPVRAGSLPSPAANRNIIRYGSSLRILIAVSPKLVFFTINHSNNILLCLIHLHTKPRLAVLDRHYNFQRPAS